MIDVADVSEEEASASHGAQPAATPPLFSLPGSESTAIVTYRLLDRTPLRQLSRASLDSMVMSARSSTLLWHMRMALVDSYDLAARHLVQVLTSWHGGTKFG
ncbi:uncharacterized protein LOC124699763 isoform X2 [Lolium rigidum]|uniref:uncharacterized protein LOC124650587 isoform X2 n=1 Tax=Lolium rigidum TaxID=89674 RepID=UPI001F5CB649|nr:uncharacterized protein LOC124650587 isoform X2 [Lolium rigidum]XP_047087971.1 uncharacterized protein LOC124699763 isoform X2 [Lolium rigidum]